MHLIRVFPASLKSNTTDQRARMMSALHVRCKQATIVHSLGDIASESASHESSNRDVSILTFFSLPQMLPEVEADIETIQIIG